MWADPRTVLIWNRLGLTGTNGAIILSMEIFEKALDLARDQGRSSAHSDKEGGDA